MREGSRTDGDVPSHQQEVTFPKGYETTQGMNTQQREKIVKEAYRVALEYVRDAGYDECHIVSSSDPLPDGKGLICNVYIDARRGPHVSRKAPVQRLLVRVRVTGPDHKTYRPAFVTSLPADT